MNDVDASSKLKREQFEGLISNFLDRVTGPLEEVMKEADINLDEVHSVELVGGTTRVPAIRERIKQFFGKPTSNTLNADEAVARGATFSCAQLSPAFRLKEFAITDIASYPIAIQWEHSIGDAEEDTSLVAFPRGNHTPSTKVLTFSRNATFDLEAAYADPSTIPGNINPWIGKATIKNPSPTGELVTVKVKARLNANGLLSFEGAYTQEETEEEVPPAAEGEEPQKRKKVIKHNLSTVSSTVATESSILAVLREQENSMHASDKLVSDTVDRKNALEEYVYDMRSKLEGKYLPYVQPTEAEKLKAALNEMEEWLYTEEGEDATKSAYVTRIDAVHALGDPVARRHYESEVRPRVISNLRESINAYMTYATSNDEKYDHIDPREKESVVEKAANIQKWLDDNVARQAERPQNVDPVLTEEEVEKKRQELIYFATPIFSKLKPKPKTETPPPQGQQQQQQQPPSGEGTPSGWQTPAENGENATINEPSEMDVD